jgi:lipopolysaccharide transport system permease protein
MIRRQYQIRYRQSFIGFLWALVPPLATLAAATLIFNQIARIDTGKTPYPIFAFSALVPWSFFATSLSFAIPSVIQSSQMVTRLPFPRAVLPISMVGTALIDLAIASATYIVFAYATGYGLPLTALWYPVLVAVELFLVVGVALIGSAMNVFARDVKLAIPIVTQLWLFLTPVLYPLSHVPRDLQVWYKLNPMTGIAESFRSILVAGQSPDLAVLAPTLIEAAVLYVLGSWYFSATEPRFADVI